MNLKITLMEGPSSLLEVQLKLTSAGIIYTIVVSCSGILLRRLSDLPDR